MSLQRVRTGDPLRIPAGDWNKVVDATRTFFAQQAGVNTRVTATVGSRQTTVIFVKNASDTDQPRFAVLGVDTPIVLPGALADGGNDDEFQRQVALSCVLPSDAEHRGRFVVLLEPIAAGAIGRACAAGVTAVRLNVVDENETQADVLDGDAAKLTTVTSGGAAQVLWKEPPPEGTSEGSEYEVWAVVRFGTPGGDRPMMIKLTGAAPLLPNRWSYSAIEQIPEKQGRYKDKLSGWTGTAYNTIEANNAPTGIQGSGDDVTDFPEGVELQPLGAGAVVPAWRIVNCEGNEEVHFTAPNNAGGSCEGGTV